MQNANAQISPERAVPAECAHSCRVQPKTKEANDHAGAGRPATEFGPTPTWTNGRTNRAGANHSGVIPHSAGLEPGPRYARAVSRGSFLFIVAGAAAVFCTVAVVQAQQPEYRPTLHEYIEPPKPGQNAIVDPDATGGGGPDLFGADPDGVDNPSAFRRGDKILPKPQADVKPNTDEPIHGRGGFGADRSTESRPDYQTGPDDTLHYIEVFNPSIVPFKRMTALDAVREDYVMIAHDRSTVDLAVGGETSPGRDLFWASMAVEFRTGEDVAIPSVAPDMRILSYEITPDTKVTFSKDGADNYYVRADEAGATGTFRLVFLADADVRYFAPSVPAGYRVYDINRARVRPVPDNVRQVAERGLRHLGVHRNMDVKDALDTLVYYFRQFEAKDAPPTTGDIYWDLFISQAGVCRHRSFAFMVTANTLGLPTRYVTNEAHAFVEVWVPDGGGRWVRVDLGGAASTLEVSNAGDKSMYRPHGEDTLPQPEEYANNYTRLEGDIDGLTDAQKQEARTPMPDEDDPWGDPNADPSGDPNGRTVGPGQKLPELPSDAYIGKVETRIAVSDATGAGYRGESIEITGRLTDDDGGGLVAQRVDLYLAPVGYDGDYATLVGHTVTTTDGTFATKVAIPRNLELGDYKVFAATPGDDTYAPALSSK